MPLPLLLLAALLWLPLAAAAQRPPSSASAPGGAPADTACSYRECGLGIAPSLVSLDVVRGRDRARVARLGFFWPGEIRPLFAAHDSAAAYADRAVRGRRVAALLTNAGLVLVAAGGAVLADEGEIGLTSGALAAGGGLLLGLSYPLQLRADDLLSQAVWWYNTRFVP